MFQRYSSTGVPLDGEQLVNTTESGNQNNAVVAAQSDGTFAIAWESDGPDGSDAMVTSRFFLPDGTPTSGEIQLNQTTPCDQEHLAVTTNGAGGYVVVWGGEAGAPPPAPLQRWQLSPLCSWKSVNERLISRAEELVQADRANLRTLQQAASLRARRRELASTLARTLSDARKALDAVYGAGTGVAALGLEGGVGKIRWSFTSRGRPRCSAWSWRP